MDEALEEGLDSGAFDYGRERFFANKKSHYSSIIGYNVS
jgi:hypothetical protein